MLKVRRALISVYDKRNLGDLVQGLHRLGVEILSTGGTYAAIAEAEVPVLKVADVTGFPEILDGRVKTLHPAIHGGILADRSRSGHLAELNEHAITPIDLVVVNLYPFRETAASRGTDFDQVVEMIDIGGPCMVRAAAKNHRGVIVVVDPDDYPQILTALQEGDGEVPEILRRQLAIKAFRHTEAYDAAIAHWLERESTEIPALFHRHLLLDLEKEFEPRYGENPHQAAALYRTAGGPGVYGGFEQLQGKELSYNNLLDADAARKLVASFDEPAVVIVKHNNPSGVGRGDSLASAYERAFACDPVSAFGSVIALNRPADGALAEAMADLFVEVVIAPGFGDRARSLFAAKKNLRLIEAPRFAPRPGELDLRGIAGGFLAQAIDAAPDAEAEWRCVSQRVPTAGERRSLELAWKVCRHVKSNAIVLAGEDGTLGVGAGQMSRVDSCRIAVQKAADADLDLASSSAASDAFFPFRDGVDTLATAGVTAIIQPGGSRRDEEVIAAADEHGMAMLVTGRRHFKH